MIENERLYNKRRNSYKNYGKVYTPIFVTNKMIDFIDFSVINKNTRFLEPSFGKGVFYFNLIDKLLLKYDISYIVENMLYGVELDEDDFNYVIQELKNKYNYVYNTKSKIYCDDFLLHVFDVNFDFIIGNPPYVSFKNIHSEEYERNEYIKILIDKFGVTSTSDLYVSFFIKSLSLLKDNGRHIFICSDSWISSKFGENLRNEICKYNFKYFITSPYEYFFDFDTNAIITVIDNDKLYDKCNLYYDGFDVSKKIECDIKYLIKNKFRNILCVFPDIINENFIVELKKYTNKKIGDFLSSEKSNLTFNKIKDDVTVDFDNNKYKLFYQDQARVNKPALYKNNIKFDELKYSIQKDKIDKNLLKNNNIYISSIMDRLMLIFWLESDELVVHTSKYYSLKTKGIDKKLSYFLLINPITQINLEIYAKESTKRSKRIGECGFTKELDDKKLLEMPTIDIYRLKNSTINKMLDYINKWQNTIEIDIYNIYQREDYNLLMSEIFNELGIDNYNELKKKSIILYYKRMRNIKYRN